MADTAARLLRLLALLQTPRAWSGPELARRLDVSVRTVRNDVARLRGLGYPVHAANGPLGGYRLGPGSALPPLLLDDEEAVAVAVGLRGGAGSVVDVEESAHRALAKLEQVLPQRLRARVDALRRYTVAVPPESTVTRVPAEVLTTIVSACRDRERLRFDYRSHDGSNARREAEPYRLVTWRRWYLVGWDVARADWRTYRVDRLHPRTPNGPRFTPRPLPHDDLAAYVLSGVAAATWRHRTTVTVHAPAELVAERLPAAVGPVEAVDEHTCRVRTGSDDLARLALWFGGLGVDFTVTEPAELVAHLRALADRYRRAVEGVAELPRATASS